MSRIEPTDRARRASIAFVVLFGCVFALAGPARADEEKGGGAGGRPPTSVRVARLALEELQERRRVTGELRAVKRSRVATNEPGLVSDLPVEEGTAVKRGDVVAVLDSRRLAIDLRRLESRFKSATASIEAMDAELALTRSDVDALRALATQRATNKKEVADAESAVRVAEARLEGSRQDLDVVSAEADMVRIRLEDTTIRAPIDGIVIATHTERGEWVAEGDPIVEIVSSGVYDAWLNVPQRYASSVLGRRQAVQVAIDASDLSPVSQVPTIVPQVDPTARTFAVYVRVEDKKNVLAPGMSVTGWVPTGDRASYLTVPRDALMRNQAGFYVYAAKGGPGGPPMATPIAIRVEFETSDSVAIRVGALNPGDLVVIEGNERLSPMMPLSPIVVEPDRAAARETRTGGS